MMGPSTVPLHLEQNTEALEIGIFMYVKKGNEAKEIQNKNTAFYHFQSLGILKKS